METATFYRDCPAELCQGDVFDRIPLVYLSERPPVLEKATLPGHATGFKVTGPFPTTPPARPLLEVPAACFYARAMLLTYDCEIDKHKGKYQTVALLRPLEPLPEPDKVVLRENRKFSAFFLPALPGAGSEMYVDFRVLATVSRDVLEGSPRLASLSTEAWKALLFQYIRFRTRYELDTSRVTRP